MVVGGGGGGAAVVVGALVPKHLVFLIYNNLKKSFVASRYSLKY